jgi:enoyl-[acyl-carrier-protein] reductase (NADH)
MDGPLKLGGTRASAICRERSEPSSSAMPTDRLVASVSAPVATVTIEEVGAACVFLSCRYAAAMTGEMLYIDGGHHILR